MSRFEQNLTALGVKKWKQIHDRVNELNTKVPENADTVFTELARLIRVTEFLSATVESAHPFAELINPDIQNLVTNFENRLSNSRSIPSNQLNGHISKLNDEATTILSRLSPYLSKTESARSAGQAFGSYRRHIEAENERIRKVSNAIDESVESIKSSVDAVKAFRIELLEGTEGKQSIDAELKEKTSQIDQMLSTTESFYKKLTGGDAESASIENQISTARERAVNDSTEIANQLEGANKKLVELDKLYAEVIGSSVQTDDAAKTVGLKGQLDNLVSDHKKKFLGLSEQIESLLPGATSAGLATAYNKRRIKAEKDARFYSQIFFVLMVVLGFSAAATFTQSFSLITLSWELISFSSAKEYLDKLLFKLPMVIPVLWAALTVSKRRSEMHRLAEEYAHKEALAMSYQGFKQQISEFGKDDDPLIRSLLEAILEAIALNSAKTLEGKHGEKMPLEEIVQETIKKSSK